MGNSPTVPAAPSAAPPASGAGSPPAGGEGATPAIAGASPESEGLKNLRNAYESLKKEHEPWAKLGVKPEEVTRFQGVHTKLTGRAVELAKQLNYDEKEVLEELISDPYGTLRFLEDEAAKAARDTDPAARMKAELDKRLTPLERKLQEQAVKEVNARFDGEFDRIAAEAFKDAKLEGTTEADLLYDISVQMIKMDKDAIARLREGKISDVQKYFNEAKGLLDAYFLARSKRESGRGPETKGDEAKGGGKRKFTIDDIAADPGVLGSQYAE